MSFYCIYILTVWGFFAILKPTRKFMLALIPWLLFAVIYNLMRLVPNYEVNPIDIRGIYETEKEIFGVTAGGVRMTLAEYFNVNNFTWADFLSGVFYICWVPVPAAYSVWLYCKGRKRESLKASIAFLTVNLIGFVVYYVHPAAPPWYVLQYGFEPRFDVPGSVAGLARFDALVHLGVFRGIYTGNSNIFAAVPSLHSAYVLTAAVYVLLNKGSKTLFAAFSVITVGIWCTAVYACHHYVIDVLLGIADAAAGIVLLECVIYRIPCVKRGFDRYVAAIS